MNREILERMLSNYPEKDRYNILIALHLDQHAHLINARAAKITPERKEFDALRKELQDARESQDFWRRHTETWKDVARKLGDEITELKNGTRIPRLEAELEHWKEQWRHATRRIGHLIEHQGNVELLEDRLQMVRSPERLLTTMGYTDENKAG